MKKTLRQLLPKTWKSWRKLKPAERLRKNDRFITRDGLSSHTTLNPGYLVKSNPGLSYYRRTA